MAVTKIDKYVVFYSYSADTFAPRIWLHSGGKYIGQLIFRPNGSPLPPDSMSGNKTNLYYHLDDFQTAIDLLRNESPVYLDYAGSNGGFENGTKTK